MGYHQLRAAGCGPCVCKSCLYWWSSRCPFGSCFDDYRASFEPYNWQHPEERTEWTNWDRPGEQEHWCRGAAFYPAESCEHYVKYTKQTVTECLMSNIQVFQDGFIRCSIIESVGCQECYRRFNESKNLSD